jgi:hypothetical protein
MRFSTAAERFTRWSSAYLSSASSALGDSVRLTRRIFSSALPFGRPAPGRLPPRPIDLDNTIIKGCVHLEKRGTCVPYLLCKLF